jgi:hypothetical protein
MKSLVYWARFVLFFSLLAACGKSKGSNEETINPGDKAGDFLVTTAKPGEATFFWELDDQQGKESDAYFVDVAWGTKLVVPVGIYDDTHSGKLDENWADLSLELYIDNRLVNLAAFGTIESKHQVVGVMRHYNVMIVADKPGKITIHQKSDYQGKSEEWSTTYTFLPPE